MRRSLPGSGCGENELSSLNSTIVSSTRDWISSIRCPSRGLCWAKLAPVRAGSWQIRQFVPSR